MSCKQFARRQFLGGAAALAVGALLKPRVLLAAEEAAKTAVPKATDLVTLGKTGIKLTRLGVGTGTRGASVQKAMGKEAFVKMLHHALDQGVNYIDTADRYGTHEWVGAAIRGRDRSKLFVLSKVWGTPADPAKELDRFRGELGIEYFDTVLLHCAMSPKWVEERKKVLDALLEAKQKKIVRSIGVSCHTMSALRQTTDLDWLDMVLVRINPQNVMMETSPRRSGPDQNPAASIQPVVDVVKQLRARKLGTIGMKILGEGNFTDPAERDKSIRFAMTSGLLDAVTIGFKNTDEIDEAITRMNRALAEGPKAAPRA